MSDHSTPAYKGRSAAFRAAMSRSAEKRRCPKCQRKSALVRVPGDEFYRGVTYCRWEDCDYVKHWEPLLTGPPDGERLYLAQQSGPTVDIANDEARGSV